MAVAAVIRFLVALLACVPGGTSAETSTGMTVYDGARYVYDVPAIARVDVGEFDDALASPARLSGVREGSASPLPKVRGTSTTPLSVVNATNTVNGVNIKGLMGAEGDAVVLGRQVDTAIAKDWPGHVVLDTPNWNLAVNDAFISETIAQGRSVYLATPLEGNLVQTAGRFAGQPTIYARELEQLVNAGYRRVGDYMVPPGG